ncbi:MAG TPA: Ran-binding zinc finger domain-containing protein [Longimicrobium sp.]|nr:Ran-binding zinc finger domain-containing protein [Longimicrobium sp.]
MAIREGRWDCPSCGSKAIYGRHTDCPGCGMPRPAGIRFYLTDDAPVITDPERLKEAKAGADWVCEHCGASNRATVTDCAGCGAPRGSSPTQRVVDYKNADVPRGEATPAPRPQPAAAPAPAPPPKPQPLAARPAQKAAAPKKKKAAKKPSGPPRKPLTPRETLRACGCVSLMAIVLVFLVVSAVRAVLNRLPVGGEDLRTAVVEAKHWERSAIVEQRRLVDGEGWQLPDSAQVVRRERRFHHNDSEVIGYRTVSRQVPRTERVQDGTVTRTREVDERVQVGTREYVCGQRDLGNGYFEDIECEEPVYETRTRTETYEEPRYREVTHYETVTERVPITRPVPIYQTYYTWRVPQWNPVDTVRLQGDATHPAWPADTLLRRGQRWGPRQDRYTLTLRQAGQRRTIPISLLQWPLYRPGQRLAVREKRVDDTTRTFLLPPDSMSACRRWHLGRDKKPPPDSLGCSPPPPRPAKK